MATSELLRIFAALEQAEVRYLVVGGVAVVLHGHLRLTADLDLVLDLRRENAVKALRALAELGYRPRIPVALEDFADPALRRAWIDSKGMQVFSLWNPSAPGTEIDLFVREPFDFEAVDARATRLRLDGICVPVLGLEDLIALKRSAGRERDLEDVRALSAILAEGSRGRSD